MTREEAIKELSCIADEMPSMECENWIEAISMAIKALEQSKWILVNKQLPIKSDYYFATIKESSGEKVVRSVWYDGEWKIMSVVPNVIAWMPLPEPYKGKPGRGRERG